MRHTPQFVLEDVTEVKRLIRGNAWMTFVSPVGGGIVASHYAALLEETGDDEIVIVSHFGRPDEVMHELGRHEVLVIVQGPHGYISPSWYEEGRVIPTWNHVTAHLWGVPVILSDEENFRVLGELTEHFESRLPDGRSLTLDEDHARRAAMGTVGLRIRVTRFDARAKLSQNMTPKVRERITAELAGDGPYAQPALAAEMRRIP